MTDPDREALDRETRDAVDALVQRLRNKGDADDEPFAMEYLAFLKGLGWRPVLAVPASADWRRRGTGGGTPDPTGEGGAEYLAWKAERGWVSGQTGPQQALRETGEFEALREGADP
jgi:hypothetical protein